MTWKETICERNFRALRKTYAEYADVLSAVRESPRYSFEVAGGAVLCRDSDGRWIHGPEDPSAAAMDEAERVVGEAPELYIVLRPGLGYQALAIDEVVEKRSPGSIVLVIEDRLELLKSALERVDWSRILRSPFTLLLLGSPNVVMEAFLERHPKVSLLPVTVVTGPDTANESECRGLVARLTASTQRIKNAAEEELASADVLVGQRRSRGGRPRVLMAGLEFGYLSGPIADGFRECGCLVDVVPGDTRTPRDVRAHEWFWHAAPLAPDLVLWANRPELSRFGSDALRTLGVASVLWTMDSPRRIHLKRHELSTTDLHLCFDPEYLPACAPLGARESAQLSLAAGIQPVSGAGPSDSKWPPRLGPDIAFVGSLGDGRVAELRTALWAENREYAAFLDALAKEPGDPSAAFEKKTGKPYEGMPCFYVDEVRSAIRRIEVLSRLPRSSLRIFGGADWVGEGTSFAECYAGSVRYGPNVAYIYYHAIININVFHAQCLDSTNSRVYDVLAAGGFLLTEDRPVLHREFEVGRHLATFSTPAEASDKVAYYLTHSAEREAIARAGQRHVLEHHTFAQRCRRLLGMSHQFMGPSRSE